MYAFYMHQHASEIPPEAAPAALPLQSSPLQPLFLCFGVSVAPPSREPYGVVYIGYFRSNVVCGRKNQVNRRAESQKSMVARHLVPFGPPSPSLEIQVLHMLLLVKY
jgi:hypothetical protein